LLFDLYYFAKLLFTIFDRNPLETKQMKKIIFTSLLWIVSQVTLADPSDNGYNNFGYNMSNQAYGTGDNGYAVGDKNYGVGDKGYEMNDKGYGISDSCYGYGNNCAPSEAVQVNTDTNNGTNK
jgi:hypothetical protein